MNLIMAEYIPPYLTIKQHQVIQFKLYSRVKNSNKLQIHCYNCKISTSVSLERKQGDERTHRKIEREEERGGTESKQGHWGNKSSHFHVCSSEPQFNKLCIKTSLVWVEFLLIIAMNVQQEAYRDEKLVNWDLDPPEVPATTWSFPFLFSDILLAHAGHSWGHNLMRFVHCWYLWEPPGIQHIQRAIRKHRAEIFLNSFTQLLQHEGFFLPTAVIFKQYTVEL